MRGSGVVAGVTLLVLTADDDEPCNGTPSCDTTSHECVDGTSLTAGDGCTTAAQETGTCKASGSSLVCTPTVCGDGTKEGTEQCDDANVVDGDGCDADCSFTEVLAVAASYGNTCVLLEGGRVRCWGANDHGQLGYGHTQNIGDDETPASAGDVALPEPARAVTSGANHTCALLENGTALCWGAGVHGALGYGNTQDIGDDEFLSSMPSVDVGGVLEQIVMGVTHTCGRLNGNIRSSAT